jgi:glucose-1-phosphate adenylyltransferase
MDYGKLVAQHDATGAEATVGAVEIPLSQARSFGTMEVDPEGRITAFREKVPDPEPIPGKPDRVLANMGVYCFRTDTLVRAIATDSRTDSRHDFGYDILPSLVGGGRLRAFPFVDENRKNTLYWRDIGTLDSYYEASMDLVAVEPVFNLYDKTWPIRTMPRQVPPAKFVFADDGPEPRMGIALDSIVCGGCILSGGRVERSILSPEVRVRSFAQVHDSVLMDRVDVGRHARLKRVIVDKDVQIPEGFVVGEDSEEDRRRFQITSSGVVVIPRGVRLD